MSAKRRSGNPGARPTYKGLPVPWVVRYSTEHPPPFGRSRIYVGTDEDGERRMVIDNPACHRDEDGWLWVPAPYDTSGVPEFSQVHPERQRACMDVPRCQVCGQRLTDKRPARWIVPRTAEPIITPHAPVCEKCLKLAEAKCPHLLRADWPVVKAREVRRYGVVGDVYNASGEIVRQGTITVADPDAGMTFARQRVVELRGWTVVDAGGEMS